MNERLTFAQWNIKDGGFGRLDGDRDPDHDRLPEITEHLAATGADVIVLNEVRDRRRYWGKGGTAHPSDDPYPFDGDTQRLAPLADQLGMRIAGVTPTVSGIPSAVLYRHERLGDALWQTGHEYLFTNGFGIARFDPPWLSKPLAVAAVHIGPWSKQQILAETGAAVSRVTEYYDWGVLGGDFNSLSAYGPASNPLRMKPHHRAIQLIDPNGEAWPRPNLEPANLVAGAGFCDVAELAAACEPREGESLEDLIERVRTGQAARIDRGYVTGHLRECVLRYERFGSPLLSDHWGILWELDLSRGLDQDPWIRWRRQQLQDLAALTGETEHR